MTARGTEDPRAEFRSVARYLGTQVVSDHATELYAGMLSSAGETSSPIEKTLLGMLGRGPLSAALADSYARRFFPHGVVRRRLTLALALLESGAGTHSSYDRGIGASRPVTWAALAGAGIVWLTRTVAAFLILAPVHLVASLWPRSRR
ncbi:MAG: hypothetical protein ACT4OZ_02480 [Gemmatimonadota bacterium]